MDEFGLYPREEPFDPLGVMLFKALQVVSFLFFMALLAVSPDTRDGKVDSKAEFIITMDWPDNHPDDLDLFVQDPVGNVVWYRHREAGFLTLDRDDRGGGNDFIVVNGKKIPSPIREEVVTVRGIVPGEYTVNVSPSARHSSVAQPYDRAISSVAKGSASGFTFCSEGPACSTRNASAARFTAPT